MLLNDVKYNRYLFAVVYISLRPNSTIAFSTAFKTPQKLTHLCESFTANEIVEPSGNFPLGKDKDYHYKGN